MITDHETHQELPEIPAEIDAPEEVERGSQAPGLALGVLAALVVGTGVSAGWARLGDASLEAQAAATLVVLAIVFAGLAVRRFEYLVLGLLAVRSSVDALPSQGDLSPSTVVGLAFLVASLVWLYSQRRAGALAPLSTPARWGLLLGGAAAISALLSASRIVSLEGTVRILAWVVMLVVIEQLFRLDRRFIPKAIGAVAVSVILPFLVGLWQLATGAGFADEYVAVNRINATFVHPNTLATYAAALLVGGIGLQFGLRGRARHAAHAVVAASAVLVLFTYARASWLGVLLGAGFVAVRFNRRLIPLLIGSLVLLLAVVPSILTRFSDLSGDDDTVEQNSLEWRIGYWGEVAELAEDRPLIGTGLDSVPLLREEELAVHNSILQSYVEMGLLGLAGVVGFLVTVAQAGRRALRTVTSGVDRAITLAAVAMTISVAAQLFTENLLTSVAALWYVMVAIAWLTTVKSSPEPPGRSEGPPIARAHDTTPRALAGSGALLQTQAG